jgi:hypothetical protein
MTDDIGGSLGNLEPDLLLGAPANGTIFDRLTLAGISWADYYTEFPTGATMELYPTDDAAYSATNASRSPNSSPPRRPARCRSSACSTPTTPRSPRRTLRTSSSARRSWRASWKRWAARPPGATRC